MNERHRQLNALLIPVGKGDQPVVLPGRRVPIARAKCVPGC